MKKSHSLLFLLFCFFGASVFAQVCKNRNHAIQYQYKNLTDNQRSDTVDVLNYHVTLDVTDFTNQLIKGNCEVKFVPRMNNINSLSLDLLHMNIDSIEIAGNNLAYVYTDTLLKVILPATLNIGDTTFLTVYYNGDPQQDPSGWGGFYWTGTYAYNLGVGFESIPHNFGRVWHPCFDNFVEHATYDFTIITNAGKKAYCNGELIGETNNAGIITRDWKMSTPIPSYLAGFNVAPYTHVTQQYISPFSNDTIPIWLIALPADTTNMKNSFVNLNGAILAFETNYGPYIWNKVGYSLVPFNSGAMEHATNISYPQSTANGSTLYETLMAHELSHHWWGDLLTCTTAEHMWINEGMASYSEKLFLEFVHGPTAYFNEVRRNHKNVLWQAHITDSGYHALAAMPLDVTYGSTTYDKGADVVHTLRGYLGDSLFFLGLQTLQANNVLKNIDSYDFRDQLNAIPGIDVTDFFDGWILNEGFPEFSIDSTTVVPNGGTYDVTVYVKQKLRAAPAFYNSVPLTITFRDQNWAVENRQILASGQNGSVTFNLPFAPVYAALNEDEKISDAVTGDNIVLSTIGQKTLNHSNFQFTVGSVTDSAFVRVEHHWVAADDFQNANFFMLISPDRYWRLRGVDFDNVYSTAKINYNGTETSIGYLDNGLMTDHGSVLFNEDSLVLLYRSSPAMDWIEYPNYTLNTQASKTDKVGAVIIDSLLMGDYAFGIRISTVGIDPLESNSPFTLYPNPASDQVTIELGRNERKNLHVEIRDLNGKLIQQHKLNGTKLVLNTSGFAAGTYVVILTEKNKKVGSKLFVVKN